MKTSLSDRMVLFRAKNRITQAELADLCGLSKMTICGIETSAQNPLPKTRLQIEMVVGGEDEYDSQ